MKAKKISITSDALNELFRYEPESGELFWKLKISPKNNIGAKAGWLNKSTGYKKVGINGATHMAHRIIWLMVYGEIREDMEIDHKDGVRDNNRIVNLRLVTKQENHFNRTTAKGYYWSKTGGKWAGQICANGKIIHLGRFTTKQEARNAYLEAKKKYHPIN